MRIQRATWDDGWVGKHVNGPGGVPDTDTPKPRLPEVAGEPENRPFLYIVEDGIVYGCWHKSPAGFVR